MWAAIRLPRVSTTKVPLDDYKVLFYRDQPSGWVAWVPSIPGCYALTPAWAEALVELEQVFALLQGRVPRH
jgi:predicted RNase H-like HicB family nuclease